MPAAVAKPASRVWTGVIYLVAIAGAEVVSNMAAIRAAITGVEASPNQVLDYLVAGIICHTLILVALMVHSSRASESPSHKLLLALCLAPLTRILSLSMPFAQVPPIYWYSLIYPTLFLAAWVAMRRTGYTARQIGLTVQRPFLQLAVALSGIAFGVVEYYILRPPEPLIPELTWGMLLVAVFIMLAGTGFVEEIIFRGVAQRASLEVLGNWGIPYVAFIFAILHLIHNSLIDIVFVFAVGLFFGWVVKKSGSLLGVTLSHGITNVLLYLIFPFFV